MARRNLRQEPRFSSLAIEKEFAQITGRSDTGGLTDRETLHKVLSERNNRYLARIFRTLQMNLLYLDLSVLLADVMTIADEVDSQLSQTVAAFESVSESSM